MHKAMTQGLVFCTGLLLASTSWSAGEITVGCNGCSNGGSSEIATFARNTMMSGLYTYREMDQFYVLDLNNMSSHFVDLSALADTGGATISISLGGISVGLPLYTTKYKTKVEVYNHDGRKVGEEVFHNAVSGVCGRTCDAKNRQ